MASDGDTDDSASRAEFVVAGSKDARCEDELASGGGIVRTYWGGGASAGSSSGNRLPLSAAL